jgi:hypothetical protein
MKTLLVLTLLVSSTNLVLSLIRGFFSMRLIGQLSPLLGPLLRRGK